MEVWQYNDTSELYHWGIKGMKWGVRRYQNKDGTLTPAGKKRYTEDGRDEDGQEQQAQNSSSKTRRQSISDLSDDELRTIVNRKQSERQLRDLLDAEERYYNPPSPQNTQQQGQSMVSKVLRNAGEQALTTMTKGAMLYAGKQFATKVLNNPELGKTLATGSVSEEKKKETPVTTKIPKGKTDFSDMTDDQLRALLNRVNTEKVLDSLLNPKKDDKKKDD